MGITHVVRGEDHLSNTPRQLLVLEALGARAAASTRTCRCCTAPTASRSRSATAPPRSRSCATPGYLPEAVRNYLALLGWGYDETTTFFTDRGAGRASSRSSACRARPAVFDEQKLRWMNGHYIRELPPEELARAARGAHRPRAGPRRAPSRSARRRSQTLADFWPLAGFLVERARVDEKAWGKVMGEDGASSALRAARDGAGRGRAIRRAGRRGARCAASRSSWA